MYAKVTATLALVLAMAGTSMGASHYIISSSNQIKPSVLNALKGARGPEGQPGTPGDGGLKGEQGPMGVTGRIGSTGAAGPTGPEGLQGPTGPAGESESVGYVEGNRSENVIGNQLKEVIHTTGSGLYTVKIAYPGCYQDPTATVNLTHATGTPPYVADAGYGPGDELIIETYADGKLADEPFGVTLAHVC